MNDARTKNEEKTADSDVDFRTVAVIDVGASAIRMEIAQINADGSSKTLDNLRHATNLGRDVFDAGNISQESIEQCVAILVGFRQILTEYGVVMPRDVWAVGTSAVREAGNRDNFIDRIYIATRIDIHPLDIAEGHRLTFNAVHRLLSGSRGLARRDALVVELGGGVTDILLIRKGHVVFSNSYSLGLQRLRGELELVHATPHKVDIILNQHLNQIAEEFAWSGVSMPKNPVFLALSGDARFAAECLLDDERRKTDKRMEKLSIDDVERFAVNLLTRSTEEIASRYQITYQRAETLGPAMICYARIAQLFKAKWIHVAQVSFRDGMLLELVHHRAWIREFEDQIIYSSRALGEKYAYDEKHAECVAALSDKLFSVLKREHKLPDHYRVFLRIAALLHDIGHFISGSSHHKHSKYLIDNSKLFGLQESDRELIGLITRYHRRAFPKNSHESYQALSRDDRLVVQKLSAILRIADALDRNHLQQAMGADFTIRKRELIVTLFNNEDLAIERMALKQKGSLFEEVYGLKVRIQRGTASKGIEPWT